jgi:hypothetical protein
VDHDTASVVELEGDVLSVRPTRDGAQVNCRQGVPSGQLAGKLTGEGVGLVGAEPVPGGQEG